MHRALVSALALSVWASGSAANPPASKTWVNMSTGSTSLTFLNTASVKKHAAFPRAKILIVTAAGVQPWELEFNCDNQGYREPGADDWATDDRPNVTRVCSTNYEGLKKYSEAEISAIPARAKKLEMTKSMNTILQSVLGVSSEKKETPQSNPKH